MKNDNIKKINTIGKVAYIIAIIFQIASIVGFVSCIVAGCVLMAVPDDSLKLNGTANAILSADKDSKYVRLDGENDSVSFFNGRLKISSEKIETDDDEEALTYSIESNNVSFGDVKMICAVVFFGISVFLIITIIPICFGRKLAKSLEKCNSPFEDNVLKCMGNFGKSLIPLGILRFIIFGITNLGTILMICVVLMFVYIFKYGAQLQKESDELL